MLQLQTQTERCLLTTFLRQSPSSNLSLKKISTVVEDDAIRSLPIPPKKSQYFSSLRGRLFSFLYRARTQQHSFGVGAHPTPPPLSVYFPKMFTFSWHGLTNMFSPELFHAELQHRKSISFLKHQQPRARRIKKYWDFCSICSS